MKIDHVSMVKIVSAKRIVRRNLSSSETVPEIRCFALDFNSISVCWIGIIYNDPLLRSLRFQNDPRPHIFLDFILLGCAVDQVLMVSSECTNVCSNNHCLMAAMTVQKLDDLLWKSGGEDLQGSYPFRSECQADVPRNRFKSRAGETLSARRWHAAFTEDGRLDMERVLRRIPARRNSSKIKAEVWEFFRRLRSRQHV
ncbi:unnamed protein product [Arabis nemorensis]|uniref:Uncharacterized protein n=1 Tax=Arabis nemorensis TaxID=586526 RepID=A0A565CAV4_9BRAS|nr:unnamed protein product [Arabis nemorensis]